MPRVDIPVTILDESGTVPPAQVSADTANDHSVANNGKTWLEIENVSVDAATVTLITPATYQGRAIEDFTISVDPSEVLLCGPYSTNLYGSTLQIDVTDADLRFRAYRLP